MAITLPRLKWGKLAVTYCSNSNIDSTIWYVTYFYIHFIMLTTYFYTLFTQTQARVVIRIYESDSYGRLMQVSQYKLTNSTEQWTGLRLGKFKIHKTKADNIELGKSRPNKNFVHCLLGSCLQTKQLICRHRFHLFNNRKIISVFSESDTSIVQWTSVNMCPCSALSGMPSLMQRDVMILVQTT